jgi:hypothetical protein
VTKASSQPATVSTTFAADVAGDVPEAKSFVESTVAAAAPSAAKDKHNRSSIRSANVADPRVTHFVTTSQVKPPSQTKPLVSSSTLKAACDPPYQLDALGRKHFKRECYVN